MAAVRGPFRAAAQTFVPELANADVRTWDQLEAIVVEALATRPPGLIRQLVLFIQLLDLYARLRYGSRLARLSADRRTALLRSVERAPVLTLRRGLWGLRTLVFMGYYTQAEVAARIGYRANPRGWEART